MKPISKDIENCIVKYLQEGHSTRETAKKVGVSQPTVYRVANRVFPDRVVEKKGRPLKMSRRDKLYCVRQITTGGKRTAVEVRNALENDVGVSVNSNTVRRTLKNAGLGAIIKPKKPHLSSKNVKERLAWARAHLDWTMDDWQRVVWSDETKIDRFGSDGARYAWVRDGERLQPGHVRMTVKHGGGNIKLWSCITCHGVGYIVKIDETLDKELYQKILEDDLMATIEEYGIDGTQMIFQHDNDPKHTAKSVKEWLENQPFEVMKWPAQSPDLNPIENMWSLLKQRLYRDYDRPPKGMCEHWERIHQTWYKITKEECQKFIETVAERCRQVIKAKGYWIKF
jgi:transposase